MGSGRSPLDGIHAESPRERESGRSPPSPLDGVREESPRSGPGGVPLAAH